MSYKDILRPQLEQDEGRSNKLYKDSVGKWTIGVGRNVQDRGLRNGEIDLMLSYDIEEAEIYAKKLVPNFDELSDARKTVLVNMSFNLGYERLGGFVATLKAIREGRFDDAADGMLASKWAQQVGDRAKRLADAMRAG